MSLTIGVLAADNIAVGLVENHQIVGTVSLYPEQRHHHDAFEGMHAETIVQHIQQQIDAVRGGQEIAAVGLGLAGITKDGLVEESPNLQQIKGHNLGAMLADSLTAAGLNAPVKVLNDADAIAAGIAATRGHLDKIIRVWFLGNGIGYGRYPHTGGILEGGHTVVSLDPKERFCSCGGIGHLEGIMGYRAMRLRFLDLEPEEVFQEAQQGDERCRNFVELWHRALAAATATSIHLVGSGKFYITGPNAQYLQVQMMQTYLDEMVTMSLLRGSSLEIITTGNEDAIVGAAVSAAQAYGIES